MYLKNATRNDFYSKKRIPIFTEDEEYRLFLNEIVDFLYKQIECLQQLNIFFI